MASTRIILLFVAISVTSGLPAKSHRGSHGRAIPPEPRFDGVFDRDHNHEEIASNIKSWSPNNLENVWELSGLHEGDIMIHPDSPTWKNGLLDATARWPGGVVPYFIQEDDFDRDQIELIKEAMQEYHERTCLRFRPYKDSDDDYVTIQAKKSGCWSLVGRHGHGQVLNLQNPGCIHHGVVVHELMHALGFYHQQSAADRDEWVTIHWENIKSGKEHNFNKYDNRTVTDYGIGYDYKSVMHYSSHAFSRNGEPTITPKVIIVRALAIFLLISVCSQCTFMLFRRKRRCNLVSETDSAKRTWPRYEQCTKSNVAIVNQKETAAIPLSLSKRFL
ncbi:PREDICTED: astacin isoform X1 [Wasmannia auropunctata]|uniref:astacin isoform X1 n=1 Tax=Wasmannia auropunctata TaxID=64793 RepID=UPI0005EE894B|nr:PREDICTED: astacin isoform X1 [Wasmannia auropunctata]